MTTNDTPVSEERCPCGDRTMATCSGECVDPDRYNDWKIRLIVTKAVRDGVVEFLYWQQGMAGKPGIQQAFARLQAEDVVDVWLKRRSRGADTEKKNK